MEILYLFINIYIFIDIILNTFYSKHTRLNYFLETLNILKKFLSALRKSKYKDRFLKLTSESNENNCVFVDIVQKLILECRDVDYLFYQP